MLYEEVLGAGMAVRYNDDGVIIFVFLDDEDREHRLHVEDLDEGWREKLLKALNGGK